MKLIRLILVVSLMIPISGFSQCLQIYADDSASSPKTNYYISQFLKTDQSDFISTEKISSFISKLDEKKGSFKNEHDFLHYLFVKAHQKLLKNYTEYCSFSSLIKDGTYNCLTGTALYAILLDHVGVEYKIVETNYHIFLIASTSKGEILFEATDPINGFVDSSKKIEQRISTYKQNEILTADQSKNYYKYSFNLYNTVSMSQLLGLMYYNLSIESYNRHELPSSISFLDQAVKLYQQSPRIEAFSKIILLTVSEGNVTASEKEVCLKQIQSLRKKMPGLASNSSF